jgi:hypothetical protein
MQVDNDNPLYHCRVCGIKLPYPPGAKMGRVLTMTFALAVDVRQDIRIGLLRVFVLIERNGLPSKSWRWVVADAMAWTLKNS